ncbi:MAG: 1-O-methyltransferase [Actinomycetota bacterium]|jgi:predicted O-methyltransferase YrrM|nr:1-O-methyltransferase [Actinomycetota bacterium]
MDETLRRAAVAAKGFMPPDEGLALHEAAARAARTHPGLPFLEVGTYCGKSAIYLGAAARDSGTVLFTVDHHHGSEENQAGWEHHDESLVDPVTGRFDTLPTFRRTIERAELERTVIAIVGDSTTVAAHWTSPLAFLFIDGGHGHDVAWADYRAWTPKLAEGGTLAIHDVFPDPADGGRPPYELYQDALAGGAFTEAAATGSLRVVTKNQ